MLSIRLDQHVEERLNNLAKRTGRTKSFYARQAIEQQLEDLEDYYLAAEAYAEHLRSGRDASTLEEVSKRLGLDD